LLIGENNAQFQNAFGAWEHVRVVCEYDLKAEQVISVDIGKAFELKILPPPNRSEPVLGQRKSVASGINPIFNYARPDCAQVAKFFLARRIALP
jgi:hypothetical protein